ncbi:MAG: HAD-IB family hydrolase [Actinomycetaceae bacterium]|nr:HAD-IB family hydrolase [Actinomycetaceae bacterium]
MSDDATSVEKSGDTTTFDASAVDNTAFDTTAANVVTPGGSTSPETSKTPAAFFDIDGTLIRGATSWYLTKEFYARRFFGVKDIAYAGYYTLRWILLGENKKDLARLRCRALQVMKGRTETELTQISEEVCDHILEARIIPGAKDLVDYHISQGHEVWLVSATPHIMARQVAKNLGATGGLGSIIDFDENGMMQGMSGDLLHGPAKAHAVTDLAGARNLDLDASYAYSDSAHDRDLFGLVGHPVAVNPEAALKRLAKQMGWPVVNFKRRQERRSR